MAPPRLSSIGPHWPYVLFALTGITGVLAEQGFEKYMSLLVGATAAASAVVIFTYFLGFALGSWITGAFIRRNRIHHPLRVYGLVELLVGVSCVAFSYSFHPIMLALGPLQGWSENPVIKFATRFVFGSMLILPSAALMGASFPLIARVVDSSNLSHGHSWLRAYALNLGGAVLASVSGAYAIMPVFGVRGALWLCLAICCFVFVVSRMVDGPAAKLEESQTVRSASASLDADAWVLMIAAFGSGFVFFALEIVWTHLISIAIGSSVYAFSTMLTTVLLGLMIAAVSVDRSARRQGTISYSKIFQFTGLLLLLQLRLWDWSQVLFTITLPRIFQNFFAVESIKLAIAAILIVPSAALLGAIYPCLLRSPVLERPGSGYLVGYVNTWNSLGCLAGALAGVFLLIPVVGAEWTLKLAIVAALGVSLLFLRRENPSKKAAQDAVLGIAMVLALTVVCRWDKRLIASGRNVYFGEVAAPAGPSQSAQVSEAASKRDAELIFFDEAAQGGITTVVENTDRESHEKERVLMTNGKFEGSDNLYDQGLAQIGFAAIPSQFSASLGRALLIGLGTGQSALTLSRMGYAEVDIAEFAPGIIKASRQIYGHLTEGALDFPNVSVHVEDGRNFLLMHPQLNYDLITIEITSVWFEGATNVYSREFYELAKSRLRPRGVLQQWIQFHHTSPREILSEIATLRSEFPYVSLWLFGGQGMMIASLDPQVPDAARVPELVPRARSLIKLPPDQQVLIADALFRSRLMSVSAVDRMIAQAAAESRAPVINTDNNRWLEYATPRYNSSNADWVSSNVAFLRSFEQ